MAAPDIRGRLTVAVLSLCAAAPMLRADEIQFEGQPAFPSVQVVDVRGGDVVFTVRGRELAKPIARLAMLKMDEVPQLERAEAAFAKQQYRQAATLFEQARRRSNKTWVKTLVDRRLLSTYDRAGRFDEAVEAYVGLLDSLGADAADLAPANLPDKGSQFYPKALRTIDAAIRKSADDDAAVKALKTLKLRILEKQEDPRAAELARELAGGAAQANGGPPAVAAELVLIRGLLKDGKFAEVVAKADELIPDADAKLLPALLLAKGRAQAAMAGGEDQTEALLAAGLTLMRVAIHFPRTPEAPEALAAAAEVHERLQRPAQARRLYEEAAGHPKASETLKRAAAEKIGAPGG